MKRLSDFGKGLLVGIGNIAPGLSGGVIAVILNVYNRLLKALNEFFKRPMKVIRENFFLLLGLIVGILFTFLFILKLIALFPIPTMMLFVGFIIGPLPHIYADVRKQKTKVIDIVVFVLVAALIIGLSCVQSEGHKTDVNIFLMFIIGVITASTMIIPGVSGTAILMVLGVFTYLVNTVNNFLESLKTLSFSIIFEKGLVLVPFALGFIIGLIVLAKVMAKLFVKYSRTMNWAVMGLLVSCPFSIISTMIVEYNDKMQQNLIINIIVGIMMLIGGSLLSIYMSGIEKKNEQVQDIQ